MVPFLARRGGVARYQALRAAGFNRAEIERSVRSGLVLRPAVGIYQLPAADASVALASLHAGRLTCVSAAAYYNLWQLTEHSKVHLQVKSGVPRESVVAHRTTRIPTQALMPLASLADVLLDALRCLPEAESLVMVQSAVGHGDIDREFLRVNLPGRRNAKARGVLDLAGGRADSVLEVLTRASSIRAGIRFEQHVLLPGVGEVDFLLEGFLIIELDGATHFAAQQIKKDRRRDNASALGGYLVLRYYYDDVVHNPGKMLAQITKLLTMGRQLWQQD